jgi:hypothetical protein
MSVFKNLFPDTPADVRARADKIKENKAKEESEKPAETNSAPENLNDMLRHLAGEYWRLAGTGFGKLGLALRGKDEWVIQLNFQRLIVEQNRVVVEQNNKIIELLTELKNK